MPAGASALMLNFNVAGYAPGEVDAERGNTAQTGPLSPIVVLGGYFYNNLTLDARHAFVDGVEVGAILSMHRIGGAARVALVQEDRGAGLSMAAEVAGGWRPMSRGPWGRAGVDVSRRTGELAPLLNLYLTYGKEQHTLNAPAPRCESFGEPGCSEYGPSLHYEVRRDALRLHGALGMALPPMGDEGGVRMIVALEPDYTLWAAEPEFTTCRTCAVGDRFVERGGLLLTLNTTFSNARRVREEP